MLPPVGPDLATWAGDIRRWLARSWDSLTFRQDTSNASQDGLMMWDVTGYPVVSKDGVWRQIILADGYAMLAVTSDITAAAANTAYAITWDAPPVTGSGVSVSGADVTFVEAGLYSLTFTAQIQSSSASTINFWFWPRVNGVDVAGSTMKASLHNNGGTAVVSRTALFPMDAGDVLRAMWATDSTSGILSEEAATAFAPETPAATLSISRVQV